MHPYRYANPSRSHVKCWESKSCAWHAAVHALQHDTWAQAAVGIGLLLAVVAFICWWRGGVVQEAPVVVRSSNAGLIACAAAAVAAVAIYVKNHHPAPVQAAPRPAPHPTITHVTVQHTSGSSPTSWGLVVIVIVVVCVAGAVAITAGRRGES